MNGAGSMPVPIENSFVFRVGESPSYQGEALAGDVKLPLLQKLLRRILLFFSFKTRVLDRNYFEWPKAVLHEADSIKRQIGNVDIIIGSSWPGSALRLAKKLSKKWDAPWVADFRDLGALYKDNRHILVKLLDRYLEKSLIKSAAGILTVSQTLEQILSESYRKPTGFIYNSMGSLSQRPVKQAPANLPERFLYYAGTIHRHRLSSIKLLVESVSQRDDWSLVMRVLPCSENLNHLAKIVSDNNFSSRFYLLPPAEPELVAIESSKSTVNLVFEDLDPKHLQGRGTLTGKLFWLLKERPPILAVARRDSEIGEVLRLSGRGKLCDSVESIQDFLKVALLSKKYALDFEKLHWFSDDNRALQLTKFIKSL